MTIGCIILTNFFLSYRCSNVVKELTSAQILAHLHRHHLRTDAYPDRRLPRLQRRDQGCSQQNSSLYPEDQRKEITVATT